MLKRLIARLDVKGSDLVKGINLEGLRVLGDPAEVAEHYYEAGADELAYQDVVASLYDRNSLKGLIAGVSGGTSIPMSVGGGIRTLADIESLLRSGADKVVINTAAMNDPAFISQAVKAFGASTICIGIEAIKQRDGNYHAFTCNGREATGKKVGEWSKEVFELGAGEIFLTSVDREGTGSGFNLDLIRLVTSQVSIPVIAHGGAGSKEDVCEVLKNTKAAGVAIASILHYEYLTNKKAESIRGREGNTDFLKSQRFTFQFKTANIKEIRRHLLAEGIPVRPSGNEE